MYFLSYEEIKTFLFYYLLFYEKARQSTHVPGRDVTSIAAVLFLIIAIRKAVRFRFLTLFLHFERKQCDLTNNLLVARLINRLRER